MLSILNIVKLDMSWKVLVKLKSCVVHTSLQWQDQLILLEWSRLSVSRTDGRGNKQIIKWFRRQCKIFSGWFYKKVRAEKRKDGRKWCSSSIIGAERWRLAWCGAEKKRCFHRLTAFEAEWRFRSMELRRRSMQWDRSSVLQQTHWISTIKPNQTKHDN